MSPCHYRLIRLIFVLCLPVVATSLFAAEPEPHVTTLPVSRGGQDLLGKPMPNVQFDRWIGKEPHLSGSVTLYRWWTDTCPFCAKTLPAIEQLQTEFGSRGLKVVAVYHPKPPRDVADEKIATAAARIGYHRSIAVDSHWDALRQIWLSTGQRHATSVSFLVDQRGIIRFVHPGVQFFPSTDPEEAQENADFLMLRNAIDVLLPKTPATQPSAKAISESDAEEIVSEIPEVGRYMDSVSRNSHGQSHGVLFSQGHPDNAPAIWQIYVGEDRDDDGASCWHTFRVDSLGAVSVKSLRWIALETWRGQQEMQNAEQAMQNAK